MPFIIPMDAVPVDKTAPNAMYWVVVLVAIVIPSLISAIVCYVNYKSKTVEIAQTEKAKVFCELADSYSGLIINKYSEESIARLKCAAFKNFSLHRLGARKRNVRIN